jgi:hypothetical protein
MGNIEFDRESPDLVVVLFVILLGHVKLCFIDG